MKLNLRRLILFSSDVERLAAFYRDVVGLEIVGREPGWVDLAAGDCNIAVHKKPVLKKVAGKAAVGSWSPKIVFYAADVAAARAAFVKRGAKMGEVKSAKVFDMCDGFDPDGNRIGISSRK